SIDLRNAIPDPDALRMLPKNIARRHSVLPIKFDSRGQVLTLAVPGTINIVAMDQIAAVLGSGIGIATLLAGGAEIESAIERCYEHELSIPGILREIDTGNVDVLNVAVENEAYNHPLIRLVDAILADAVKHNASDVHLEPEFGFLRVRYRIDGVLRQAMTLHRNYSPGIAARLKAMSKIDLAKTCAPRDGYVSMTLSGRRIDLRVACQATTHGENFVLRLQDRDKDIVPLEKLEFRQETLTSLQLMLARPEGIFIVAGPSDSGKTSTLYSMLNYLNDESVHITTLEDPAEYPLAMVRQTSLNTAAEIDYADGIRSALRQDPDIIMVGELRDEKAARMAFRAAMTGHRIFTTLLANNALAAIPRLIDIGVKRQMIAGNITGILAQRLVRRLCIDCKQPYAPNEAERRLLGISSSKPIRLYREGACDACNFLGYKGRIAVVEVLKIDAELDDMIARVASRQEMHQHAVSCGLKDLADEAIRHVRKGLTSVSEISRVVDLTARLQ
ncbi:MAG: ATPase, T2SS/T4P/T4SS family, partial [Gammaproteobacteria bacterium]|nr:ATPase, T2SS/T4P/T4SS family [Gammaproteobacteria bacterium]